MSSMRHPLSPPAESRSSQAAVSAAVTSGHLRAAALDVFVGEPKPNPTLLQVDGLALTPHIGAATLEAQDRIGDELVERILELR